MKILLFILLFSFVQSTSLLAKSIKVTSPTLASFGDIHYGKASPEVPIQTASSLVYVRGSCFKKNLRSVTAPLSPSSSGINLVLRVTVDGTKRDLRIRVPVNLVSYRGTASIRPVFTHQISADISGTSATYKQVSPNTASFQFNDKSITAVHSTSLSQGSGSSLSATTSVSLRAPSGGGNVLKVTFSTPGANGFCGGYYSPLMVFFDKKRPSFKNVSQFPLVKKASVYWPEKNAPGYFLVLDRNKDGKITKASELFRDSDKHANGFKHLATLDSNKDGLIDRDDKLFNKLQLWKDKNANGVSEKSELLYLKDKSIYYISLKSKNIEEDYGNRAKAVQRSFFAYKNTKGNFAKSEIIDFWFSVAKPKIYKSIRALSFVK